MGDVVLELKELLVGLPLWIARKGAGLKAVLEAPASADVSLKGRRSAKAILG